MAQGRITYAKKNIAFGYMGTLLTALLGFAARKLFILRLDGALLGVNDLYTGSCRCSRWRNLASERH